MRRVEEIEREEDARQKQQAENVTRRLDTWRRRRRQIDTIAARWPGVARELQAKNWPSDDHTIEMLARSASKP